MAGVDPTDLFALATELLEATEAALQTLPALGFDGVPDRSFVSPGEPAADCCPQLTVHVVSLTEALTEPGGLGAGRRATYSRINHVGLFTTLFRCVPTLQGEGLNISPPDPADLSAAAEQIYADAWAVWNHLFNRIRAGLLFSQCREVFPDGARILVPEGACGGSVYAYRVALDGYEEALP